LVFEGGRLLSARDFVSTDMTTPTFTGIHTVAVPVTDQERTKALFERLGLQTGLDTELQPGFRWIEMALADTPTSLALVQTGPELPTGIDTGIRLTTPDARAAHASVIELGLDAGELLDWETAPLMFSFTDYDGNRFYVSQV
jgi:catechol 2,3-dioxygenase-like lactoylglutathione lyase family enzyme